MLRVCSLAAAVAVGVARPLVSGGKDGLTISPIGDIKLNDEHGRVGIGIESPQATLHVPRAVQVQGAVRLGYQSSCEGPEVGTLRYHQHRKEVQICSGQRWIGVTSTPVGQRHDAIPSSCAELFLQNPALPDGGYYIKTAQGAEEQFCSRQAFVEPEPEPDEAADDPDIVGCTIPIASNYDRYATIANNTMCVVYGCNDTRADNYLSVVTHNDGSCFIAEYGCMNANAPNFNPDANVDDGTCFQTCIRTEPCSSCKEANELELATGLWWIGPDAANAHETYCDMDLATYGGGWALIMKAVPGDTFEYNSDYWKSDESGAPLSPSLNADVAILNDDQTLNMAVEAKYHAFNSMLATEYVVRSRGLCLAGLHSCRPFCANGRGVSRRIFLRATSTGTFRTDKTGELSTK